MAISYDERVIVEFAERLYRRAANIVISYVVIVGGLGALVAAIGSSWSSSSGSRAPGINGGVVVAVAAIGAILGYAVGSERAFSLRLAAQAALCQAQIEHNTRSVAQAMGKALPPPIPRP